MCVTLIRFVSDLGSCTVLFTGALTLRGESISVRVNPFISDS